MSAEQQPSSVNNFQTLIPINHEPPTYTYCDEKSRGEEFFRDYKGAKIIGITLLRYEDHDVIAFTTDDRRAIGIIAEKNAFKAVEKCGDDPSSNANLAFRDDISHLRLDMPVSFEAGGDYIYKDEKPVAGETVHIDPAARFTQVALSNGIEIEKVSPSWWTEDWITITSQGDESLVVRADRRHMEGAVSITQENMAFLEFPPGVNLEQLKLTEPPMGSIPSRLVPPEGE